MRRRDFFGVVGGAAAAWPLAASAQRANAPAIGVILQGGFWFEVLDGLRAGLKELGLAEGNQFVLDIRDTRGDLKAVEDAARALERQKVKLIVAIATSVGVMAHRATEAVPIIFIAGTDPVSAKLVESIAKPGGRATGVYTRGTDLTGKRLETLFEIVPKLRRAVTFYNPNNHSAIESSREAREAARRLGLEFLERKVTSVEELKKGLEELEVRDTDGFISISDAMIDSQSELIIEVAKAKRLPTMLYQQGLIAKGGLASYAADFGEAGRVSAKYVQQVLAGTKPAEIPVQGIDRMTLVINLKAAKAMGLSVPEAILIRADKVIE